MVKLRRLFSHAVLALVLTALAGFFLAVPSTAAPTARASVSALAAAQKPKPCGVKHYPPCPPKPVITIGPKRVHRGGHVGVAVKHFAAHKIVKVRIKGHGQNQSLGRFETNAKGNVVFRVKIPRNFAPGDYRLTVTIGSKVKTVIIHVKR